MLSPKSKRNIYRLIPFGLIWLVTGCIFLFVEYAAVAEPGNSPSTAIQLNFQIFIFATLAVTAVGLIIGTIELFYLEDKFAKKSFTVKILSKLVIYILFLSFIILITFPIAASMELDTGIFDKRVWDKYLSYLTSKTNLSTNLQMFVSLGLSLFYVEISDNIGQGVLLSFFTGKYHQPVEEKRIFMFLDMRSSTTIAEQLGHIAYFKLLREYYADLSDPIIEYGGELYQYVGDEVIVSWEYHEGTNHNNSIRCFYAMKEALQAQADKYRKQFGVVPTFKAGIHVGEVTTGEIGVIKKEIFFTGDVLNAAARIQSLCNTYHVDLLISADLLKILDPGDEYEVRSLGKSELRGKSKEMELFTIAEKAQV